MRRRMDSPSSSSSNRPTPSLSCEDDSSGACCPSEKRGALPLPLNQLFLAAAALAIIGLDAAFTGGGTAAAADRAQPPPPSVLIIGSGPAGLALLRELSHLPVDTVSFQSYDRQPKPGGMWTADRRHSPMYDGMWINGAYENCQFGSYTYETHFGRRLPSIFPRGIVQEYLAGYVERDGLDRFIVGGVDVIGVTFDETLDKFVVRSRPVPKVVDANENNDGGRIEPYKTAPRRDREGWWKVGDHVKEEQFDYVVIATGTFGVPNFRPTPDFTGEQIHARTWVGAEPYRDKVVVVVGDGDSANDIVTLLLKHGARRVYQSIRGLDGKDLLYGYAKKGDGTKGRFKSRDISDHAFRESFSEGACFEYWHDVKDRPRMFESLESYPKVQYCESFLGISLRDRITSARGRTVAFDLGADATNVDSIIYATGYISEGSYDFVEPDLRLEMARVPPIHFAEELHLDALYHKNPRLIYAAHNTVVYTFVEYEAKAEYLAGVISGRVPLPTPAEIEANGPAGLERLEEWWAESGRPRYRSDPDEVEMILAQQWRVLSYAEALRKSPEEGQAIESMVDGWLVFNCVEEAGARAHALSVASPCPCTSATYLDFMGSWHDARVPGLNPPNAELTPLAHTRYVDYLTDSHRCFLDESECRPEDRRRSGGTHTIETKA